MCLPLVVSIISANVICSIKKKWISINNSLKRGRERLKKKEIRVMEKGRGKEKLKGKDIRSRGMGKVLRKMILGKGEGKKFRMKKVG